MECVERSPIIIKPDDYKDLSDGDFKWMCTPEITTPTFTRNWIIFHESGCDVFIDKKTGAFAHKSSNVDTQETEMPPKCKYKTTLPASVREWTSETLREYFRRDGRFSGVNGEDPPLKKITHFRRYGPGRMYEFSCHWVHQTSRRMPVTWQRYTDLMPNRDYMDFLRNECGWHIEIEEHENFEEDETADWSDDGGLAGAIVVEEEPKSKRKKKISRPKSRYPSYPMRASAHD